MNTNIFIQARLNSKRFPQKVLKKICDKTLLEIISERMNKVNNINKIILITGDKTKNKILIDEAKRLNLDYFCGNEENILDRFYNASIEFLSDNIIRVTADNPFMDYNLINQGLLIFIKKQYDILSNNRIRTYPLGYNFEIFTTDALKTAWEETQNKFANKSKFLDAEISPTQYMLFEKKFKNYDLTDSEDNSHIRLTIDFPEDFEKAKKIFESIYPNNKYFILSDVITFIKEKNFISKK